MANGNCQRSSPLAVHKSGELAKVSDRYKWHMAVEPGAPKRRLMIATLLRTFTLHQLRSLQYQQQQEQ